MIGPNTIHDITLTPAGLDVTIDTADGHRYRLVTPYVRDLTATLTDTTPYPEIALNTRPLQPTPRYRLTIEATLRPDHPAEATFTIEDMTEQGRRLASERDDLITHGADPADLTVPIGAQMLADIDAADEDD